MRVPSDIQFKTAEQGGLWFQHFALTLRRYLQEIAKAINGQLSFDNIDAILAVGTTPVGANTEFAVTHNLGRVPVGFVVTNKDIAGDIYASTGGTAWTATLLYLKCTASSLTYTLAVF